jgi:hypothetical protein
MVQCDVFNFSENSQTRGVGETKTEASWKPQLNSPKPLKSGLKVQGSQKQLMSRHAMDGSAPFGKFKLQMGNMKYPKRNSHFSIKTRGKVPPMSDRMKTISFYSPNTFVG